MEQILEVGGRRFVLGLEWIKLSGTDPMLAAKVQAKSRKSPLGIIRTVSFDDGQQMAQVGLSHKKFGSVVYSAAAVLANQYPMMIAIDHIRDDLYWICVTENGRVLPGHDTAATDSEIKRIFHEWTAEYQLDYMKVIVPEEVARKFSIPKPYTDQSPLKLLEDAGRIDTTKLKNLAGISNTTYLGAAIGVLLVGWIGYTKYGDYLHDQEVQRQIALEAMEEDARAQAEKERMERLRQQPTDEQLLERARLQEITWLQEEFNANSMNSVISAVYTTAEAEPTVISGWKLQGMAFDQADLKSVSSKWERGNAKLSDLSAHYKGKGATAFSPDLISGLVAHPINLQGRGVTDIMAYLKTSSMDYQRVADRFIENRLVFKVAIAAESTRKETIMGLANKTLEGTPQLQLKKRKFDISGTSKTSFVKLMKALEPVHNMLPNTIMISRIGGGYSWKFSGTLYEL
jgi:hypothetical protein